jgi:hypothetical protein
VPFLHFIDTYIIPKYQSKKKWIDLKIICMPYKFQSASTMGVHDLKRKVEKKRGGSGEK